jgi:xylulokinase
METRETGCLGAAMLAGIGSGITGSVSDTVRRFVRTGREFLPDPEMSEKYREGFEKYKKIYSTVRTIWS